MKLLPINGCEDCIHAGSLPKQQCIHEGNFGGKIVWGEISKDCPLQDAVYDHLNWEIQCCNDCPHNTFDNTIEVGISFGLDYFCSMHGYDEVVNPEEGKVKIWKWTDKKCKDNIRSHCPFKLKKEDP